jgi:septal ring factor EnvC (AmiA/AmiB activator)
MRNPRHLVAYALLGAAFLIPLRSEAHGKSDNAYVLFLEKNSVSMSGSLDDLVQARSVREKNRGSMLWFRQAGREYVVTDPEVLHAFAEIHAAEGAQDERQDKLEQELDELDDRLEDLSQQKDDLDDLRGDPEEVKRAMADLEREITAASAKIDRLNAQQEQVGRELDREAADAGRRMRELLERAIESGAAHPVKTTKP